MFRVVAATNQNLKRMAQDREFREDLYYRLNVFLRFICRHCAKGKPISPSSWNISFDSLQLDGQIDRIDPQGTIALPGAPPLAGNIRELQNYIARRVILSNDGVFEPAPLESYQSPEPRFQTHA